MLLDFQVAKRQFKNKTGIKYTAKIALVNGRIQDSRGRYYVRPLGNSEDGDDAIQNSIVAIRERPGVNKLLREGRIVHVAEGLDGHDEIVGNDPNDLEDAGIPLAQLNQNDPRNSLKALEHLLNLNTRPYGTGVKVNIYGSIYRKPDGTYQFYDGDVLDLTAYVPATSGKQVVACVWLDPATNTTTVTTSSEVDTTTDLRLRSNNGTVITLINECFNDASTPADPVGIWSYILKNGDTKAIQNNILYDLRGIIGGGGGSSKYGNQKVISTALTIENGCQGFLKHSMQIESGGSLTIKAGGEMVIE